MKKIRINELARELEVKAHEILDKLPELGVTEKKTHSSSIDEDVALKLRRFLGHEVPDGEHAESVEASEEGQERESAAVETLPPDVALAAPRTEPGVEDKAPEPEPEKLMPGSPVGRTASHPIRPPLAGPTSALPGPPAQATQAIPHVAPPQPIAPTSPAATVPGRPVPPPPRPLPPFRPG